MPHFQCPINKPIIKDLSATACSLLHPSAPHKHSIPHGIYLENLFGTKRLERLVNSLR